jgi:hypothetical protein
MRCQLCDRGNAQGYNLGMVRGRLCPECLQGAGAAVAAWTLRRMREVAAEAKRASERAANEQLAAFDLAAEQFPLSTRRLIRTGGNAA